MSEQQFVEAYLDYDQEWREARLKNAISRGLYPTAWGDMWSPYTWKDNVGVRCLNSWTETAFENAIKFIRLV